MACGGCRLCRRPCSWLCRCCGSTRRQRCSVKSWRTRRGVRGVARPRPLARGGGLPVVPQLLLHVIDPLPCASVISQPLMCSVLACQEGAGRRRLSVAPGVRRSCRRRVRRRPPRSPATPHATAVAAGRAVRGGGGEAARRLGSRSQAAAARTCVDAPGTGSLLDRCLGWSAARGRARLAAGRARGWSALAVRRGSRCVLTAERCSRLSGAHG